MKKQIYLIILLMTCRICNAQNLVPNGDFESFSTCPSALDQLNFATPWVNPTNATPDYFNQCSLSTWADVPVNNLGFQYAHSGNGYGGISLFSQLPFTPEQREYIEVALVSPLVAGNCYYFQMYVNKANRSKYAVSDIGAYFSDTIIAGINNNVALPFVPQVNYSGSFITDTLNWTLVSDTYTAAGGESYVIIGNFKNNLNTNYLLADSLANLTHAYVYIDDVCLTPCGSPCYTGIEEQYASEQIKIHPNPITNKLNITIKRNELLEFVLYDVIGRKTLNKSFISSTSLNTEQLAKGIYIYEVRNKNGVIMKGKVVKD